MEKMFCPFAKETCREDCMFRNNDPYFPCKFLFMMDITLSNSNSNIEAQLENLNMHLGVKIPSLEEEQKYYNSNREEPASK